MGLRLHGMGAVASQIFLQRVHFGLFYVYSIVPHPTTPPIWQVNVPSIVGVFQPYAYMEGIWMFKPWSNSFFDVVAA